ncbi:MAG: WG repeat-containing protein [Bacteroidota bacterium]
MKSEIEKTLKTYLQAIYQKDLETVYDTLYEDDVIEFHETVLEFAEKMDVFGETEDFLKRLKIPDLQSLKKMTPKTLMFALFDMATGGIEQEDLERMVEGTKVTLIEDAEFITVVHYEFPIKMFDEWEMTQTDMNMILTEGEWKIFFKSGLRMALQKYQKQVDDYYDRKSKDQLENLQHEGDLTIYTLKGYKNIEGDTVFEARFRDAGEFSEGLAYVQVMRKYGFLNLKGELAIKPQFLEARDFSQGRAAVKLRVDNEYLWGFIDKKGKMIIPAIYTTATSFSEKLCAVEKDEKWGYINKSGKTVIPFKFAEASPFEYGEAEVCVYNSKGDLVDMVIDKKGQLVE